MATRLTTFSKFLITLAIVGGVFFGGRYIMQNTDAGKKLMDKSKEAASNTSENNKGSASTSTLGDDDALIVQIFTFGNAAPGLYFNDGLTAGPNSRFMKEYGLKVKFELIDDFDGSRQAWKGDKVHLLNNETSAMATEMEGLAPYNPQVIMQMDWSRGADAVVASREIRSVNDLKGQQVAVAPSTPSQTLLLFMLEAANLKPSDIKIVDVPTTADAETAFKGKKVAASVVWDPQACLRDVPGSHLLLSTKDASNIIADVYMVKKDFADKNREKLQKFYEGWMKAVAEINTDPAAKQKAAKIMAANMNLSEQDALGMINNLRLTNHGDNLNFFGKNNDYKGVTGEALYRKMGDQYQKMNLAPANRPNWQTLANSSFVGATNLSGVGNIGEGQIQFKPASDQQKTAPAIATKPVSISFATGQFQLDENAKTLIDVQFSDVAKGFGKSRVRIEGNTDNVGSAQSNKALSLKRAQSVADYLRTQYNMNPNRFVIVGNGPDKPVPGCEKNQDESCRAKNRRTDFQLIGD